MARVLHFLYRHRRRSTIGVGKAIRETIPGGVFMAAEAENTERNMGNQVPPYDVQKIKNAEGETGLLLEAFQMFTKASSSLETAFCQLQDKAQKLTEELEAKNIELEKSLREKEEAQIFLRTILERLPCGVLVLDREGEPTLCNPMASDVLAFSGNKSAGSRKDRYPHIRNEIRSRLAASAATEEVRSEIEIPVKHGKKQRILATSGAPLTDVNGERVGTLHILRDITEVKALQEQSKRVERLSAMGEMAVELAHEIRNPLGSVELFASLLEKELRGDLKRWAENIRIGSQSLNNIVSNMLHFANPLSPAFYEVNVHEIIHEVLQFTDPIANQRRVGIEKHLEAGNPVISADAELLKQMLLNLIMNAMNAMPAKGYLRIRTRNSRRLPGGRRGLELQIRDSGVGIPPENLKRIFDPFFTTHKKGTGLGLSVVHQIVEQHSGIIKVSSEVNRGTTFTVVLSEKVSRLS